MVSESAAGGLFGMTYLMEYDLGDLAYPIALIIMSIVGGLATRSKRKKKKQAEFEESIKKRSRPRPEAKRQMWGLEDLVEVLLPEEVKRARRAGAPQPGPPEAKRKVAPVPPLVESPLRPARPPAPARPRPARPRPAGPVPVAREVPRRVRVAPEAAKEGPAPAARGVARALERTAVVDAYEGRAVGRAARLPSPLSRDDLRRAIILNEVLGQPVASRDPMQF